MFSSLPHDVQLEGQNTTHRKHQPVMRSEDTLVRTLALYLPHNGTPVCLRHLALGAEKHGT